MSFQLNTYRRFWSDVLRQYSLPLLLKHKQGHVDSTDEELYLQILLAEEFYQLPL